MNTARENTTTKQPKFDLLTSYLHTPVFVVKLKTENQFFQ